MYIVSVTPLVKLPANAPSVLDYFCNDQLPRGSLVRVSIGRRAVTALVHETRDIRSAKMSVKKSDFSLKRIVTIIALSPQLSHHQIELARWLSNHYACSLATALTTIAPLSIGKRGASIDHDPLNNEPLCTTPPKSDLTVTNPEGVIRRINAIHTSSSGQTLILVPDRIVAESLQRKITATTTLVHSGLPATELKRIYRDVLDGTITNVIGTRNALFLPWSSLRHVIVEDPLNELYKSDMTPRLNASDTARQLALLHGAAISWLTSALSTVQFHLQQSKALAVTLDKQAWPAVTLTSTQEEETAGHRGLFSRQAQHAILDAYERAEPILIYSARRGYAMTARCRRCHHCVQCANCSSPMRWHRTSENMLVCYRCDAYQSVPSQCPTCKSGAIAPTGSPGSQKLAEAIQTLLDRFGHPKPNIPILDSDLVLESDDASRVFGELDASPHPILVATSMILSYRYVRRFSTVIVPNLDLLASNPDYRSQDRLVLTLEKLGDFQPERLILQTFQDDGLTQYIENRRWSDYFTDELAIRKQLRWPPYSRIIKLTFNHRDRSASSRAAAVGADRLTRAIAHLKARGTQLLGPAPALVEKSAGKWSNTIIIKSTLPSSRLSELLAHLPDGWLVDIDPRSIS